jgi:hypothetical protein
VLQEAGGLSTDRNRQVVHGSADSDAMKGLGKPGSGESHARFDELGQEMGRISGPQRLQLHACTAPDLLVTAPAPRLYSPDQSGASRRLFRVNRARHASGAPSLDEARALLGRSLGVNPYTGPRG